MGNLVSDIMNHSVADIMSTDLITIAATDGLEVVKKIFETYNIHHIPVVEGTKLIGIVSKTDYYKAFHDSRLELKSRITFEDAKMLTTHKVSDLMTKHVVKITPEDKIGVAAELFLTNYFHAVPVVTEEGELKGIITSYDILKEFFKVAYPSQELGNIVEK